MLRSLYKQDQDQRFTTANTACYGGNQTPKMVNTMEQAFLEILKQIGEDPTRAGLVDTPKRAAKAMEFLTQGYSMNIEEVINNASFPSDTDEMVIVKESSSIRCANITCFLSLENAMLLTFQMAKSLASQR